MVIHPDIDRLKAYCLGKLAEVERAEVRGHLSGCPVCRVTVAGLPHGGFVEDLRRDASALGTSPLAGEMPSAARGAVPESLPYAPEPTLALHLPGLVLQKKLGQGGMGTVYLAWQESLKRLVAVKVIKADEVDAEDVKRFQAEAEAVAQLKHPNIVPIYHIDEHEGRPYFLMEYLDGGTLADRVAAAPLGSRQAAAILSTLADASQFAHESGIIHRDLKPGNILFTVAGKPLISDFGLAKRVTFDQGQTRSGTALGTPSYMPPEQAAGNSRAVTPLADVYSLGAILYELLTGRPPFKADNPLDTLLQVIADEPVPPRRLQPRVARDLETICLKCLEKKTARRYESALALAEDLRRYLKGVPIVARPTRWWERSWKWAARRPAVAALLFTSAIAFVIFIAAVVGWSYSGELKSALDLAEQQRTRAESQTTIAESEHARAEDLKGRFHYLADLLSAQDAAEVGTGGMMALALSRQLPGEGVKDRRGFEWYYLWRCCHRERDVLGEHRGMVKALAYSPQGDLLASAALDGAVYLWDPATMRVRHQLEGHQGNVRAVAFSTKGDALATAGDDGTVRLWDCATFKCLRMFRGHEGAVASVGFSGDDKRFVTGGVDGTVRLWSVAGPGTSTLIGKHTFAVHAVALSPDGKWVASGGFEPEIYLWETANPGSKKTLSAHRRQVTCLAFDPKGGTLASGSEDGQVLFWDWPLKEEAKHATLGIHRDAIVSLAFTANGEGLATASFDQTVKLWKSKNKYWGYFTTLIGHTDKVTAVAVHPDGRKIASGGGDQTIRVWDVASAREPLPIPAHDGEIYRLAFSRDGKRLASTGSDHAIRVWDSADGEPTHLISVGPRTMYSLALLSDGKTLVAGGKAGGADDLRGQIQVWDLEGRKLVTSRIGHEGMITTLLVTPDQKRLVTASLDHSIKVWRLPDLELLHGFSGHTDQVHSLAVSPDGDLLASGGPDQTLRLWEVSTGRHRHTLSVDGTVSVLAFSPDGKYLVAAGGKQSSESRNLRVWETTSWTECDAFTTPPAWILDLAFSPDGKRLATASKDQTVKLWDFDTRDGVATFREHHSREHHAPVRAVAFSPDGSQLASGDQQGIVYVRRAASEQAVQAATKQAVSNRTTGGNQDR